MFGTGTRLAAVAALALSVSACSDSALNVAKHLRPVTAETRALMTERNMDLRAPILVRIFKAESQLEVWKQDRSGRYAMLRSFEICRWSGDLGPKVREGDRQAPEGFYTVTPGQMNPNSSYHLAFNTGYPNSFDRAHGRTGAHLMVHGDCSSRGCFAMTNAQMEEIFALARDAFNGGQRSVQLQIMPFRMTAENMFRFRRNENIAFWRNLKEGSDHFEATGRPPEVAVCGRRYVFNRRPTDEGARFDANAACPPAEIPSEIRIQVARRAAQDAQVTARLEDQYRQARQPSMLARLTGQEQQVALNHTPVSPYQQFPSRQAIRAALPSASPEALSLLPGVEQGPTQRLRQIARGEVIEQPAARSVAVASAEPQEVVREPITVASISPARIAAAGAIPVPAANPLRPAPSIPAQAETGVVAGLLGGLAIPSFVAAEAPAAPPPTAQVPLPTATPRAQRTVAAAPVPPATTAPVPASASEPSLWQRFIGRLSSRDAAPVSSNPAR